MRGEETQSAQSVRAGGESPPARSGPRHAAPRKSLLNRIQGPAGKAMALAAMPTAVFVGMGLTPKLALADEKDIPFAPGPCVTRSDEPAEEKTPKPQETPKPEESTKPAETPAPTASASASALPGATATPSASPSAQETAKTATTQRPPTTKATPTPTATKSVNPLDPLGVGDALKDLFDGPGAAPTPSATTKAPVATTPPVTVPSVPVPKVPTKVPEPVADAVDKVADTTKDAIKEAAGKVGATVEELPEDAKGLDAKKDEDIPEGAKPRFPCPEPDPEALAAAELEEGVPLLPDEPWILNSTKLTLKGLKYHGIVEVKTGSGKIKKVLKFTAKDGVDIKDLHQRTVHSAGLTGHVRSDRGSTSTMSDGTVTMYTEQLKGSLFGLIPVTFNPQTPPPVDVPYAFFTNVEVIQAGQFGGTLTVPGLRNTIEPS